MKRLLSAILTLISLACLGQTDVLHAAWTTSNQGAGLSEIDQELDQLMVRPTGTPHSLKHLQGIFRGAHKKVFHQYEAYANIDELSSGKYDCLTATTFMTALLQESGFAFDILETNYHIFLLVHTTDGDALVETTDRLKGIVIDPSEIESRLKSYQEQSTLGRTYEYKQKVFHKVSPEQLAGLLWFNQAVKEFNHNNWMACAEKLSNAMRIYPHSRGVELATLLLYATTYDSKLSAAQKAEIKSKFPAIGELAGVPVASR